MPRADQIRCTVAGLTPARAAIVRHHQCASPSGLVCKVHSTIWATVADGITGFLPRPARTLANSATPRSLKSARHDNTVCRATPTNCAICTLDTPSAASSSTRERYTIRNGAVCDRARVSSTSRSPSDTDSGPAAALMTSNAIQLSIQN